MTSGIRFGYIVAMPVTELRTRTRKRTDPTAAQLLIELRERKGLDRSDVPRAMALAGIARTRIPSVKTIWRIEERGDIPSVSIKAALAEFYGRDLHSIWPPHVPRCAA